MDRLTLPLHPDELAREIAVLSASYETLVARVLGKSLLGRPIPLLLVGRGRRKHLYVGAHHGAEAITSRLLLGFVSELLEAHAMGARPYGLDLSFLLESRMLCFVPMLNPDGVAIAMGEGGDPLVERRRRMPGGDAPHRWQANARGVDLNHNYRVGFEEYKRLEGELGVLGGASSRYSGERAESEPESAALAAFARTVKPSLVLSLHTQGEEIFWQGGGVTLPGAEAIARRLASLSGYRLAKAEGPAAYGGFCDYTTAALRIPSFTLECGKGENPLSPEDAPAIYRCLRRLFFESIIL